jgi:hypothetical protein
MADIVTVRTYLDPVEAEIAGSLLRTAGIEAFVHESGAFNPLLSATLGTELRVSDYDLERAREILAAAAEPAPRDEVYEDEPGAVRCPRCELTLCFHERARIRTKAPVPAAAWLSIPTLLFGPKRWRCHKCGHVWDDPNEGPQAMTRLLPDDPHPVFRLRRGSPGMGLFVGAGVGLLLAMLFRDSGLAPVLLLAAALLGWLVGRTRTRDVCSGPDCRSPLGADVETCPRCRGTIAGVVRRAAEHYSAAADFRRDLAQARKRDGRRRARRTKRADRPGPKEPDPAPRGNDP